MTLIDGDQLRFLANMAKTAERIGNATTQVENNHLLEILRLAVIGMDAESGQFPPQDEPPVSPAEAFARLREAGGDVLDGVDALNPEPPAESGLQDALGLALRELFDEQNGPPLERRRAQWQSAQSKARAALQWYDASLVRAENRT